ncbi:glycosyltransferase family 2 protein [Klebsiella michiganensis]|uniref:glycosyltransferase family 2 protein n=1 Tax=Klebsiella michiganensis TaxID=1134687 RepID=UPI00403F54E9
MKYYIAIPTYNGGELWHTTVESIKKNVPENTFVHVIDSGSKDDTAVIAKKNGFDVVSIQSSDFNHGGTRNQAINHYIDNYDVVIFLTQDAIPEPGFIDNIMSVFQDEEVVCAYGRQLPHSDASPLAQHARLFNYPINGYIACKANIPSMGLKTVFMSNSFSAYRLSVFKELGGFPSNTILCEDMYFTAKAILAGYKVAYVPEAKVHHSHNYSPIEEFKRYFDIGVFHTDEPWIRHSFGGAGGEGKRFIISELKYLIKNSPSWIPVSFLYNMMKIIGFKMGKNYKVLPKYLIKKFSMHKRFWKF